MLALQGRCQVFIRLINIDRFQYTLHQVRLPRTLELYLPHNLSVGVRIHTTQCCFQIILLIGKQLPHLFCMVVHNHNFQFLVHQKCLYNNSILQALHIQELHPI